MFFKNLHLFRLHDAPALDVATLEAVLGEQAFRPLGGSEARRMGWSAPAGRVGTQLVHELQGHRLITATRQERILPAEVVRREVEERVAYVEAAEGRKAPRHERLAVKEQVYEELLPQAFIRHQRIDLWWDTHSGLIGIDCASRTRAEEVLDLLRETLGSLKVTPLATQTLPMRAMTEWLSDPGKRPADLVIGDSVELKAKGDDGVVRGKQVDLDSDEMQQLLESGRMVSKMALSIEGAMAFVLHDDLAIKALRFDDRLIDEAGQADDGDDPVVRLETDFLLMARALAVNLERLIEWLGGEAVATGSANAYDPEAPADPITGQADPLYAAALAQVVESGRATPSGLQRHLMVGYNRACHLLEGLEQAGKISPMDDRGGRRVLAGEAV